MSMWNNPTISNNIQQHPTVYRYVGDTTISHKRITGWWFEPLWKIWKSVGIIIPSIWKIIKFMFQTTNQIKGLLTLTTCNFWETRSNCWKVPPLNVLKQEIVSPHPGKLGELGSMGVWKRGISRCLIGQWSFQEPKMEVLYHIRPYVAGIFPYIGLIYGTYLQFRILKFPLNREHDEIHQSIFGYRILRQFDGDFRTPQNMEALYHMKPASWGHIFALHSPLYKPYIWWVAPI